MTTITITEALAELKTTRKRIEKKREFVQQYLLRQDMMKDPLEKEGGSVSRIEQEMQAINDLEERYINLRLAISRVNSETSLAVNGKERSIEAWLVWRRDVSSNQRNFLSTVSSQIHRTRGEAQRKGISIGRSEEVTRPEDVIVNLSEAKLSADIESLEEVLGVLDGKLSLKNATVTINLE